MKARGLTKKAISKYRARELQMEALEVGKPDDLVSDLRVSVSLAAGFAFRKAEGIL